MQAKRRSTEQMNMDCEEKTGNNKKELTLIHLSTSYLSRKVKDKLKNGFSLKETFTALCSQMKALPSVNVKSVQDGYGRKGEKGEKDRFDLMKKCILRNFTSKR